MKQKKTSEELRAIRAENEAIVKAVCCPHCGADRGLRCRAKPLGVHILGKEALENLKSAEIHSVRRARYDIFKRDGVRQADLFRGGMVDTASLATRPPYSPPKSQEA